MSDMVNVVVRAVAAAVVIIVADCVVGVRCRGGFW